MEQALRLSRDPAERAQAALGVSLARFLAAELPEAVAACEAVLASDGELDRELRLALEFQAAATRLVGGLPDVETFGRLLALEPEVRRGETAAERGVLALIALVYAATTAHPADRGGGARRGGVGRRPPARRGQGPERGAGGAGDDGRADRGPDRDRARGPAESRDRGVERGRRGGPGAELAAALLDVPRHAGLRSRVDRRPRRRRGGRGRGAPAPARRRSDRPAERAVRARRRLHRAGRSGCKPRRWCATPGRPGTCRSR